MIANFTQIVVADFEYEAGAGDLPNVLCLVACVLDGNLQHVRTIKLWRGEFGKLPPFDIGPHTLFVAYSSWAEMTCFLQLGWPFPECIYDLHTAFLAATNVLHEYDPEEVHVKESKRLPDACRAYGIKGWEHIDKKELAEAIGESRWREAGYTEQDVVAYCEEDVNKSAELLRRQITQPTPRSLKPISTTNVIGWSEYSGKAVAQIQARGMPIDTIAWNAAQDNKAVIIADLIRALDPSQGSNAPIYSPDGEFALARFESYLVGVGVEAWPRTEGSGILKTDSKTMKAMYHVPGIEQIHGLRDAIRVFSSSIPIGRDGRNRPSIFPFGTRTGRNAHRRSLFNCHAGLRSFMLFPEGSVPVYNDWRTQEIGVAAALSGDEALMAAYTRGDIYHALAVLCGTTNDPDPAHWKKHNPEVRQRMKTLQLGINYGMSVASLSRGLERHNLIGSVIIDRYARTYPDYWSWRQRTVNKAMVQRRIVAPQGWTLHLTTSPNQRALSNFPMQGGGAAMMQHAAVNLCEAGIVPSMPVHDAFLMELKTDEQVRHALEIMGNAGRAVCNGFTIGVDREDINRRFADKRPVSQRMWATIVASLKKLGAWSGA